MNWKRFQRKLSWLIWGADKAFLWQYRIKSSTGAHSVSYPVIQHAPNLSLHALLNNIWNFTSIPSYILMAWCLIKHKDTESQSCYSWWSVSQSVFVLSPDGAHDQLLVGLWTLCFCCTGALSLTRQWVCPVHSDRSFYTEAAKRSPMDRPHHISLQLFLFPLLFSPPVIQFTGIFLAYDSLRQALGGG